jgi:hypothetical protein
MNSCVIHHIRISWWSLRLYPKHYPTIWRERLRKTIQILYWDSSSLGQIQIWRSATTNTMSDHWITHKSINQSISQWPIILNDLKHSKWLYATKSSQAVSHVNVAIHIGNCPWRLHYNLLFHNYEGESANRSQMDIKHKTCDIRTWTKHLFLNISSTNIDTLVPSLYQYIEAFRLLSQSLPHLVRHHLWLPNVLQRISQCSCEPLYATNTSHHKQETFLYEHPLQRVLLPIKTQNGTLLFSRTFLKHGRHFVKPASEHAYAHLLLRLSWSWTVLLPSDTLRKPLRPLQLFYFHFLPIYWLSLI